MTHREGLEHELKLRTTKSLQIYGDFLGNNPDDDTGGCQDYTSNILLDEVRIVNEAWLLKLIERQIQLEELLEGLTHDR